MLTNLFRVKTTISGKGESCFKDFKEDDLNFVGTVT